MSDNKIYAYPFPWEREAINGKPLPAGLNPIQQHTYTALRNTGYAFRSGWITRELAAQEKQEFFHAYDQAMQNKERDDALTAYHVAVIRATEAARNDLCKEPTVENGLHLSRVLDGLERPIVD